MEQTINNTVTINASSIRKMVQWTRPLVESRKVVSNKIDTLVNEPKPMEIPIKEINRDISALPAN